MDTANLIEEAERWAKNVSESPGIGTAGEDLYLAGLLDKLAAALKASEEQNGAIRRGLDWERAEREKVAEFARKIGRERDDLAAANLAANKRIVELEHERDAARAELARLTTPRPIAEAPLWMPVNRDSAYGEPPRDVLDRHLRNGGLWLVEDSAAHAHRAIFRTWKHPTEDRICWADARGEGLFLGRIRPLLFAPLDIDCNRLLLPVLP